MNGSRSEKAVVSSQSCHSHVSFKPQLWSSKSQREETQEFFEHSCKNASASLLRSLYQNCPVTFFRKYPICHRDCRLFSRRPTETTVRRRKRHLEKGQLVGILLMPRWPRLSDKFFEYFLQIYKQKILGILGGKL